MKNLVLATTAFSLLSFSALAADLPSRSAPAVAPAPVFTWTGFYVGANAGYGFGNGKGSGITYTNNSNDRSVPDAAFNMRGGLIGAQVGYNYQIGNIVLGAEADIAFSAAKGSDSFDVQPLAIDVSAKLEHLGTVRARVGYAFNKLLIFGTGGFAYGSTKVNVGVPTVVTVSNTISQTGYALGGGVEYAVDNNWSVKAEYLYVRFAKKALSNELGSYPFSAKAGETSNVLRLGVNYKF